MAIALGMMIGGTVVNAAAFSGGNYLASILQHRGADAERKRHDLAVEQLQHAQVAYSQRRTDRLDWLNEELRRKNSATQNFSSVDQAMREYAATFPMADFQALQALPDLGVEPTLGDFYVPSDDQKNRELLFVALGMTAVGAGVLLFPFLRKRYKS